MILRALNVLLVKLSEISLFDELKTIRLQVYTGLQTGVAPLGEKNRMTNQNVDVIKFHCRHAITI